MGEKVELPRGYLAAAIEGAGLGVLVLADDGGQGRHIQDVCVRFAAEGITALAPDPESPDEELAGAVDFLLAHPAVRGHTVGVVGFGAGGGRALGLAAARPEAVAAAVPFYPVGGGLEDARVEGHYPGDEAPVDLGPDGKTFVYPGARPGFFDDTRPDVYDEEAARVAWVRTLEFLRAKLG